MRKTMPNHKTTKHHIEILFPVILFSIFALAAITVILFAARIYKHGVDEAARNYSARTSYAYVSEKIRRSDAGGVIGTESFNGEEVLSISDPEHDDYVTYIYLYDGSLRELYMRRDAEVLPETGTEILPLSAFSAEDLGSGLIRLTCTGEDQTSVSGLIAVRSGKEA